MGFAATNQLRIGAGNVHPVAARQSKAVRAGGKAAENVFEPPPPDVYTIARGCDGDIAGICRRPGSSTKNQEVLSSSEICDVHPVVVGHRVIESFSIIIASADDPVDHTARYGHGIAGRIGILPNRVGVVLAAHAGAVTCIDGVADNVMMRSRTILHSGGQTMQRQQEEQSRKSKWQDVQLMMQHGNSPQMTTSF